MNDWKQTQFGKEYDAFRQELDDYYAAYPTDVSALEQELDEKRNIDKLRELSLIHISEPTRP